VENRSVCSWNEGSGLIGVQSRQNHPIFADMPNGIQGYAPPGRNTGQWEAQNEAWRFTPSGEINNTIKWFVDGVLVHDVNGNAQGSDTKHFVLEQPETTIRVEGTYLDCNRGETVDADELTIIMYNGFQVDLGPDISTCELEEIVLTPIIIDED